MTAQGADKAITTSALLVAGIYTYRRLTEGAGSSSGSKTAQLLGQGSPPSVGVFITAWGTAYLIMAILAQASPGLGGAFAIATGAADVLSNGQQLFKDINGKVAAGSTKTATAGGGFNLSSVGGTRNPAVGVAVPGKLGTAPASAVNIPSLTWIPVPS